MTAVEEEFDPDAFLDNIPSTSNVKPVQKEKVYADTPSTSEIKPIPDMTSGIQPLPNLQQYIYPRMVKVSSDTKVHQEHTVEEEEEKVYPCPKHYQFLMVFKTIDTSTGTWSYYRCPASDCFAICGEDEVNRYIAEYQNQVHEYWKTSEDEYNQCYCGYPFILKISKSEKNPGRMYFKCKKNRCDLFLWADMKPSSKYDQWQMMNIHYADK